LWNDLTPRQDLELVVLGPLQRLQLQELPIAVRQRLLQLLVQRDERIELRLQLLAVTTTVTTTVVVVVVHGVDGFAGGADGDDVGGSVRGGGRFAARWRGLVGVGVGVDHRDVPVCARVRSSDGDVVGVGVAVAVREHWNVGGILSDGHSVCVYAGEYNAGRRRDGDSVGADPHTPETSYDAVR